MRSLNKMLITLFLIALTFSGCDLLDSLDNIETYPKDSIVGSGYLVSVSKTFSDFQNIEASHLFDITIIQSNNYSVEIEIDDNLLEYLIAEKHGDKLSLGLTNNNSYNNVTARAVIGMPDIHSISLSGASCLHFDDMEIDHSLSVELSGASKVTGNLTAGDVYFQLSGASYMNLTGSGDDLTIDGSGASSIEFGNFHTQNASINLSGASYSLIYTDGLLDISLSGASVLYYKGNPTIGIFQVSGESVIGHL